MATLLATTVTGNLTISDCISSRGLLPTGAIIPLATNLTGVTDVDASTANSYGMWYMNGTGAPAGSRFSNSATIPNITGGKFLMGYTDNTSTGGGDNTTLSDTNYMPNHSHGVAGFNHGHNWNSYNHSHSVNRNGHWGSGPTNYAGWGRDNGIGGGHSHGGGNNGAHSHGSNNTGGHSHNSNNTGSGSGFGTHPLNYSLKPAIRIGTGT